MIGLGGAEQRNDDAAGNVVPASSSGSRRRLQQRQHRRGYCALPYGPARPLTSGFQRKPSPSASAEPPAASASISLTMATTGCPLPQRRPKIGRHSGPAQFPHAEAHAPSSTSFAELLVLSKLLRIPSSPKSRRSGRFDLRRWRSVSVDDGPERIVFARRPLRGGAGEEGHEKADKQKKRTFADHEAPDKARLPRAAQ